MVLVTIFCWVVFGWDYKTSALPGSAIDGLDDVDGLLFVLHRPVDLVVVTGALKKDNKFLKSDKNDLLIFSTLILQKKKLDGL